MWISQENEDSQGKNHHQPKKKDRTQKAYHRVGFSFPKALRVLSRFHFQKIHREGKRLSGRILLLQYREGHSHARLGITVSKKYGKAHDRNRFKRVVREAFRECYGSIPSGLSLNISPKLPKSPINKDAALEDLKLILSQIPC
jgi:ribonuclease P protein component